MNIVRIATRLATSPLSDRPDYGSNSNVAVPRGITSDIVKTRGEDEWCVVSPKNETWSGGCFGSEERAEDRLSEVEMLKHINS